MSDTVQTNSPSLQSPGDVDIQELFLVTAKGNYINLDSYLMEFNIYEDLFSNTLSGDIAISDSRNLIKELPIMGDEFIVIKFKTPDYPSELSISKTFRVVSITDRKTFPSIYILKFVSIETIIDSLSPIYKSFDGTISDVVDNIFNEFLRTNRTYVRQGNNALASNEKTSLIILNETSNKVKFVSPGWGPIKCINWLCSKAMPNDGKACNFLFWETNKFFYFGSIEKIFQLGQTNDALTIGRYSYSPPGVFKTTDVNRKMFVIEDLEILNSSDALESYNLGHYASRVLSLDLINKSYDEIEYDHVKEYKNYTHVSGKEAVPLYSQPFRNPLKRTIVQTRHPELFTGVKENANEKFPYIFGNRNSNLFELNNFRMKITIPGRTDISVGSLIDIIFPDVSPRDETDSVAHIDKMYSGKYIITGLRHKINPVRHYMILEIVKDGLQRDITKPSPTIFSDVL